MNGAVFETFVLVDAAFAVQRLNRAVANALGTVFITERLCQWSAGRQGGRGQQPVDEEDALREKCLLTIPGS